MARLSLLACRHLITTHGHVEPFAVRCGLRSQASAREGLSRSPRWRTPQSAADSTPPSAKSIQRQSPFLEGNRLRSRASRACVRITVPGLAARNFWYFACGAIEREIASIPFNPSPKRSMVTQFAVWKVAKGEFCDPRERRAGEWRPHFVFAVVGRDEEKVARRGAVDPQCGIEHPGRCRNGCPVVCSTSKAAATSPA